MKYLKEFIDFSDIEEYDDTDDIGDVVIYNIDDAVELFLSQDKTKQLSDGSIYDYYYEYSIMIRSDEDWELFVDKVLGLLDWEVYWVTNSELDYGDIKYLEEEFKFNISDAPIKIFLAKKKSSNNPYVRYIFFRRIDDKKILSEKIIKIV
jgi:hypothetical protein